MDDDTLFYAIPGAIAAILAVVAWIGDRRRIRRTNIDRVGFMPWTAIFFVALLAAVVLLGLAARSWFNS